MRHINLIICHCSATRVTRDFSPEALEACHKARGFTTTGYHYYITKDGHLHKCRPEDMIGAHARRYNAHSIGVCYEGGLDANGKPADTRTPAQKQTLITLLRALKADYPDAQILGHRDLPWLSQAWPCLSGITTTRRRSTASAPHLVSYLLYQMELGPLFIGSEFIADGA